MCGYDNILFSCKIILYQQNYFPEQGAYYWYGEITWSWTIAVLKINKLFCGIPSINITICRNKKNWVVSHVSQ